MIKLLVKKQLAQIFRNYFYDPKKNKMRSKGAVICFILLFVLLMVVVLGGMFTGLAVVLCGSMVSVGMDWFYFTLMTLLSILLGVFGSVFNTYSSLYLAKDNDLLLSMPIPVRSIMASRLLSVYLMGLMYSSVVLLPAIIVYWVIGTFSLSTFLGGILLLFSVSLLILVLSCLLGWIVARASLKLKHKSFAAVVLSLLFFAVYYVLCFRLQTLLQVLAENALRYGAAVRGSAYPLYLLGAAGTGDVPAMVIVTGFSLVAFSAVWIVLSRSFLRIATSSGTLVKHTYRKKPLARSSLSTALLRKEARRFAASPLYMLNCGLGTVLLPIGGIVLLVQRQRLSILSRLLGSYPGAVPVLGAAAVCMLCTMNDITAPSVSLEGKSLWISQSLPISPWKTLQAKLHLSWLLTCIPALLCGLCAAIALPGTLSEHLLAMALPVCFSVLIGLFGLFLGLCMPNFTWTSETVPIKQSAPVVISLFSGWIYALALGGLYFLLGRFLSAGIYLLLCNLLTALLCAVLLTWLKRCGIKLFSSL